MTQIMGLKIMRGLVQLLFIAWASAASLYVSPNGIAFNDQNCTANTPCTLRIAIDKVAEGDEIVLFSGNYTLGEDILTEVITLRGSEDSELAPTTLSCPHGTIIRSDAGFYFHRPRQVRLANLHFTNCDRALWFESASSVPAPGDFILIENVLFEDVENAIFASGGTLPDIEIRDSLFQSTPTDFTRRVYIDSQHANFRISNVTFSNALAAITATNTSFVIKDSSFENLGDAESATDCGAIRLYSTSHATITDTDFLATECGDGKLTACQTGTFNCLAGGAIHVNQSSLIVKNSSFNSNKAFHGGAIAAYDAVYFSVDNSYFERTASSAYPEGFGGAILLALIEGNTTSRNYFITNSYFKRGTAQNGGAIAATSFMIQMQIANCTFDSNGAYGKGGAIFNHNTFLDKQNDTVTNCTFINNFASAGGGGAICSCGSIIDSTFLFNTADHDVGGAVNCAGDILLVNNTDFYGNSAGDESGGALYAAVKAAYINNCTFYNNSGGRGAAHITYSNSFVVPLGEAHITNTRFIENTNSEVAALVALHPTINIRNTIFKDNKFTVHNSNYPIVDLGINSYFRGNIEWLPICSAVYNTFFCGNVSVSVTDSIVFYSPIAYCGNPGGYEQNKTCRIYIDQGPVVNTTTTTTTTTTSTTTSSPKVDSDGITTSSSNNNRTLAIAVSVPIVVLALVSAFLAFSLISRRKRHRLPEGESGLDPYEYPKLAEYYISDVTIGSQIGAGAFGTVYEGLWNGAKVAVKTLSGGDHVELFREASLLKELRHPNVVQFLGVYKSLSKEYYMITEYVEGGNLESMLHARTDDLTAQELIQIALEIASGMRLLEQKGVIHRDLAARNILVDTREGGAITAKVSDFGMSREMQKYYTTKQALFPVKWASPEVILYSRFSSKSDVWAFGILLFEIASFGEVPYHSMTNKEASDWVLAGNRMNFPDTMGPDVAKIAISCWAANPGDRPTFVEVYNQLSKALGGSGRNQIDSPRSVDSPHMYHYQDPLNLAGGNQYSEFPDQLPSPSNSLLANAALDLHSSTHHYEDMSAPNNVNHYEDMSASNNTSPYEDMKVNSARDIELQVRGEEDESPYSNALT